MSTAIAYQQIREATVDGLLFGNNFFRYGYPLGRYQLPHAGMGRFRMGDTASFVQALFNDAQTLLNAYCSHQGVDQVKCDQFQLRLGQCKDKLTAAISNPSNPDLLGLGDAGVCFKKLYDDVKDALDALVVQPPTPTPTPTPTPGAPSAGTPWYVYALGGVAVLGLGTAIAVAVS